MNDNNRHEIVLIFRAPFSLSSAEIPINIDIIIVFLFPYIVIFRNYIFANIFYSMKYRHLVCKNFT